MSRTHTHLALSSTARAEIILTMLLLLFLLGLRHKSSSGRVYIVRIVRIVRTEGCDKTSTVGKGCLRSQ